MSKVNILVLAGYGLNCDHETAYVFELAGAKAVRVHINLLINGDVELEDFQIMVFVGGFSISLHIYKKHGLFRTSHQTRRRKILFR